MILRCATGCERETVIAALKARNLWPHQERQAPTTWRREPTTVYRFVNDRGDLVGEKGRFEWVDRTTGEQKKTFLWRLPGSEKWGGLDGAVMPLYNLPDVLRRPDEPVWFVEGEKACQSLIVRGVLAVCGYAGAGQKTWDDSLAYLDGRELILWPDNDDPGYELMARMLRRFPRARLIQPELPEKADAYDYFEQGGTVHELAFLAGINLRVGLPPNVVPIYDRPEYQGTAVLF